MNNPRRKELKRAWKLIEDAMALLEESKDAIEAVMEEEQESFDNLPDGIQCSERGEQMEEYISYLEEIMDCLEEKLDVDDISDHLSEMGVQV